MAGLIHRLIPGEVLLNCKTLMFDILLSVDKKQNSNRIELHGVEWGCEGVGGVPNIEPPKKSSLEEVQLNSLVQNQIW